MSNREDLNNIDHDLGKLIIHVAEYIKQIAGDSYIGSQQFKGTLDRVLIPYSDTQLDFIKSALPEGSREPMQAYWILKLFGQRDTPQHQDIQDELDILNQLLYKPGRHVPGLNQDKITANGYDLTPLVSLLTKMKLFRFLVENHTVIKNYIDNNKDNIDRNYPELNTQTLDWLKGEFTKIRDIAAKPNAHVPYAYGTAPVAIKALPALKIPVPVDARAAVGAPPRAPYVAPYVPPRAPYVAPYVPPYVPPRAPYVAPYIPPRGGHYVPPPRLSNWQAFIAAHMNTSWFDRFSFSRLFKNDGIFDVTPNASVISFAFYNLLFWLQIPLLIEVSKDIVSSSFESFKNNTLYMVGSGNYFDFFKHAFDTTFAVTKIIFSPLLIAGSFALGLTSLPFAILNNVVQEVNLPRILQGTLSLALKLTDVAKDLALIGAGLFYYSNFLGSFAIGPQILAKVGLTALTPFVSAPLGALALTVCATAVLLPPTTMIVLASVRTMNNAMNAMFSGLGRIVRFNHTPDREVVHAQGRGARLGDYLAHRPAHGMDADVPARELRFGRRVHQREENIAHDDARPVRRIRVR
jgi:hypothetical protein